MKKIYEAQAQSITGETLSKHHMKRKEEKDLSRVGVVLKSPRKLSGTFEGSYLIFIFEVAVLAVLVSGEDILNIADSEREIRHVSLFLGSVTARVTALALLLLFLLLSL